MPDERPAVLLLTDVDEAGRVTDVPPGFLWLETVPDDVLTVVVGLLVAFAVFLLTDVLAGVDVTRVATALPPPDEVAPDDTLLTADDSVRLTLLLVPAPLLVETLLVKTRSEPVWRLPPK